jgi:hypothetical protein
VWEKVSAPVAKLIECAVPPFAGHSLQALASPVAGLCRPVAPSSWPGLFFL